MAIRLGTSSLKNSKAAAVFLECSSSPIVSARLIIGFKEMPPEIADCLGDDRHDLVLHKKQPVTHAVVVDAIVEATRITTLDTYCRMRRCLPLGSQQQKTGIEAV